MDESDIEVDGWVKVTRAWYRPAYWVKASYSGDNWMDAIGQVLIPELRKWAPKGMYETRKNSQGW